MLTYQNQLYALRMYCVCVAVLYQAWKNLCLPLSWDVKSWLVHEPELSCASGAALISPPFAVGIPTRDPLLLHTGLSNSGLRTQHVPV